MTIQDIEITKLIEKEYNRQQNNIELIASENIVSRAVLEAAGSVLTNKYAEGYPGKRYYGGCAVVDEIENLAISRAKDLFGCSYANVQPHSGSQANQAVMLALASPGDTYLALSLSHGGHLTHGAAPNLSGKWFNPIHYNVREDNCLIDYDQVRELALKHHPKFIITGGSAYPREINFKLFREIADEAGAVLWVDMAHIAGLVAAREHSNPLLYADVVSSTTHKTLRGPRSGIILSNNDEIGKKIDKAVFPGLQGGPLMHIIAAKAVAFAEANSNEFIQYIKQVKANAQILSNTLLERGYNIITGGTDTHLILLDLRSKGLKGNIAEQVLEEVGIASNKNSVPFDNEKPTITSGLRLGTPSGTTRGFKEKEFEKIAIIIADLLDATSEGTDITNMKRNIKTQVQALCEEFPIYERS
jgi:glycine hydroxymethyltransferase